MKDLSKTHKSKRDWFEPPEGSVVDAISYLQSFLDKGVDHKITREYGYYDGESDSWYITYWIPKTAEELEKERIAEEKRKAKWEAERPKREAKAAKEAEARRKIAEKQLKKLAKELGVKLPT